MRAIKIARLKDELSVTLRRVQRGETILVTDRDRPIARLVPIDDEDGVTILPPSRNFTTLRRKRFPPTRKRASSLTALLEERGER
jgi:prevent-host-death family protein